MNARNEGLVGYEEKEGDYFGHPRDDVVELVPSFVRRLLDVGCGDGRFGARLMQKRPGTEVWGIEPMAQPAASAAARLSRVFQGNVETALEDIPDGHFDCITFNDVLEHLTDPWVILRAVRRKLAPGGVLVASIPNVRHLPVMKSLVLDGDFEYASEGVLDSTHLRFFTRKSMARLFEQCGYAVIRIDGLSWQPFPLAFRVLNRLLQRRFDDMHYLQFAVQGKVA